MPLPPRAYFFSSRAVSKLRSAAQAQCFALRASRFALRASSFALRAPYVILRSEFHFRGSNAGVFSFDFRSEGAIRVFERIDMCFLLKHPCAKRTVAGAPQRARHGQSSDPRAVPLPLRAYFFSSRAVSKLRSALGTGYATRFELRASSFELRASSFELRASSFVRRTSF